VRLKLAVLLKCFRGLRSLDICVVPFESEKDLVDLMKSHALDKLTTLRWDTRYQPAAEYSDRVVAAMCALPRLTHLEMTVAPPLTHATLSILADAERLIVLDLSIHAVSLANDFGSQSLNALLKRSRALRSLTIQLSEKCPLIDGAFSSAGECSTLRTIDLTHQHDGLTERGLQYLSSVPNLTDLCLNSCWFLTDAGLAHLERCSTLTALDITNTQLSDGINVFGGITDAGLLSVVRLPALRKLRMFHCSRLITDTGFIQLAQCRTLEELVLARCERVGDGALAALGGMKALRVLRIDHCSQRIITNAGFVALAESRTLQHLDMSVCNQETITDAALVALGRMTALRVLKMRKCTQSSITDAGFAALSRSLTLEQLEMNDCAQATITDAAVEALSRCPTLTVLNVSGCTQRNWSAAGIRALVGSRRLRILDVTNTQLCLHVALLGESVSLETLRTECPAGQSLSDWARACSPLLHASRLTHVDVQTHFCPEADAAVRVLQAAWNARPAAHRTACAPLAVLLNSRELVRLLANG
jgi:hypothetical protein